jgi:hypothetical protein
MDGLDASKFTLNGVGYSAAGLAKLRAEAQQEAAGSSSTHGHQTTRWSRWVWPKHPQILHTCVEI